MKRLKTVVAGFPIRAAIVLLVAILVFIISMVEPEVFPEKQEMQMAKRFLFAVNSDDNS